MKILEDQCKKAILEYKQLIKDLKPYFPDIDRYSSDKENTYYEIVFENLKKLFSEKYQAFNDANRPLINYIKTIRSNGISYTETDSEDRLTIYILNVNSIDQLKVIYNGVSSHFMLLLNT